jgi:PKD repeat protein
VKGEKNDIIRDLFRQKLENAEIIPDPVVSTKLMRKLARREFIRFNPAKFNAYYLGGIIAVAVTATLILYSGKDNSGQLIPLNTSPEKSKADNIEIITLPARSDVVKQPDNIKEITSKPISNKMASLKSESAKELSNPSDQKEDINVTHTVVDDSFAGQKFFSETKSEKNRLQGRTLTTNVLFEPSAVSGCPPLKIRFTNKSVSYDSCRWTFGDGGYSIEKSPEWIFDVEGEYKVVLNMFGPEGMKSTSSTLITVFQKPQARFEISPEKAVLPEDEIKFLNYSANAVRFRWNFGDGSISDIFEPSHKYSKFGNFNVGLVVTSENGCSDSIYIMNAFSGSHYFIDFPNAFIPNTQGPTGGYYSSRSDETSQVFHPVFSGVSDYQLKIFSKMGILIFESTDVNIGWDGYFHGQLSDPGVYIWKVRGNFRNGEAFTKMGDVTLLRN